MSLKIIIELHLVSLHSSKLIDYQLHTNCKLHTSLNQIIKNSETNISGRDI